MRNMSVLFSENAAKENGVDVCLINGHAFLITGVFQTGYEDIYRWADKKFVAENIPENELTTIVTDIVTDIDEGRPITQKRLVDRGLEFAAANNIDPTPQALIRYAVEQNPDLYGKFGAEVLKLG